MNETQNVEILMTTYNGLPYLREQLDSLLTQTWAAWHLTISDDQSSDGTVALLRAYAAKWPEKIELLQHDCRFGNARDHFYFLMRNCTAQYIMFCDQDDVWHNDKIEKTMKEMLAAEAKEGRDMPILIFSDQTPTDAQLKPLADSLMAMQCQNTDVIDYRRILIQNIVTGCTAGVNRALIDKALACKSMAETIMHDWWIAAVAARFGRLIYIDESTMSYRQHANNSIGAKKVMSIQHIIGKLCTLPQVRQSIFLKKQQAKVFRDTYWKELNQADHDFLSGYVKKKSGLLFYIRQRGLFCRTVQWMGMVILG